VSEQTKPQATKHTLIKDFVSRLGILGELLSYLWAAKLWWMIPMVIMLIIFALFIIFGSAGSGGQFIYTLF
jgi:hypothetical protein